MVKENTELMAEARESLSGNWGLAIATFLVYGIIISIFQVIPTVGPVLVLFIAGPMLVGISMFSLSLSRGENARLEQIFEGFKNYRNCIRSLSFNGCAYLTLDVVANNTRYNCCYCILTNLLYFSRR